jgi:hypothetical protein
MFFALLISRSRLLGKNERHRGRGCLVPDCCLTLGSKAGRREAGGQTLLPTSDLSMSFGWYQAALMKSRGPTVVQVARTLLRIPYYVNSKIVAIVDAIKPAVELRPFVCTSSQAEQVILLLSS